MEERSRVLISWYKRNKINIEEMDITKDNIHDYLVKTVELYNKGYYEDALVGMKKLSEYSDEYKTIFVPHIEKCNHVKNKVLKGEDSKHYKNIEILKHFGWIDKIKYLTGFVSFVFLSPFLESLFPGDEGVGIPFSVLVSECWRTLVLGIILAVLTYMIHSRMQKFTKSQGLVRCKYCGHYIRWLDLNEPTFGFTYSNNCEQSGRMCSMPSFDYEPMFSFHDSSYRENECEQCGRMYPMPSFYWDSWEGLEYIQTSHSVPKREFYNEYKRFKIRYKTEYNEWLKKKKHSA